MKATSVAAKPRRPYTPRMSVRARRDQLLDAALQLIARDGYSAVSIDAIARSLDVTRPVVYNVFGGLDDLLYALLDREEKRALDALTASISMDLDGQDLDQFLRQVASRMIGIVTEDPQTWGLIFQASAGSPAAVRKRVERDRELVRQRIQGMLECATAAGEVSLDAEIVSHALIALGEYFGRLALLRPGSVDADRLVDTLSGVALVVGVLQSQRAIGILP